jgi:hypothetical protein
MDDGVIFATGLAFLQAAGLEKDMSCPKAEILKKKKET